MIHAVGVEAKGVLICAECDRGAVYLVAIDGQAWATSCTRHLENQIEQARRYVESTQSREPKN